MAEHVEKTDRQTSYILKAVIDIGSTSIRMVVAQIHEDGRFQMLDSLHQSVAIGRDTFTRSRITRTTVEDAVKVLRSFSTILREYNIDLRTDVRAVATSAVREARNRIEFLDRVYIATGINVEIIDGSEVNRLTYLGIRPLLQKNAVLRENRLLVVEVGGGSTELLGIDNGSVSFAHTYRMGSYRLREKMEQRAADLSSKAVLESEIDSAVRQLRETVDGDEQETALLLLGSEARLTARFLLKDWDESTLARIRISELSKLAASVSGMDAEQIALKYKISFEEAQTLGPSLQIHTRLARTFGLRQVFVCGVTLREGLLAETALGNVWAADFVEQILHSAKEIGKKYEAHQPHAECVARHARAIFLALEREHQLEYRYEIILAVAAQLHDIGMFISNAGHHKHSQYLILNSDIFGLGREDIRLVAMVARYHRRALPGTSHLDYAALSREDRLVVNKLAAILRVADALDRTHTETIRDIKVIPEEDQVLIEIKGRNDLVTEKRALSEKGVMFEQVYGRPIVLRSKRK